MSDTRDLLRAGVEGFDPTPDAFERVLARRDRKRRNERIAAGFVGVAMFALVALWFLRLLASGTTPAVPRPEPAPSRNGKWVVISVSRLDPNAPPMERGRPAHLFVTEPGGSARLLAGAQGDSTLEKCPAFSPDGSMLAYGETGPYGQIRPVEKTLVVSGFSSSGELVAPTMRIRVPAARSFVRPCPVWAPDGQRLATIAPGLGVLIVDLDGSTQLVRLDAYGLHQEDPTLRWSPDGSQLALLVSTSPSHETVWLIPADGGDPHLLPGIATDTTDIAWTPDGRSLIAVGGACCPEGSPFVEVVGVVTGDTREVPLPTAWDRSGVWRILGSQHDRFLVWRGMGKPLAWLDPRGNVTAVHLDHPMSSFPTLSPDGRQLLYVSWGRGIGAQALIAVPLDGGPLTRYSPSTAAYGDNYATFTWQPR